MDIEIRSHSYNYYNVKGRSSPEAPVKTGWAKQYEQVADRIESNNNDPNSEKFKAYKKLEDIYYDKGVENRAKYGSLDKLRQALSKKYFMGKEYSGYSYTEKNAMYQNEFNMTAYGHCSNFQDPRLGGPVYGDTDEEKLRFDRSSVNNQIKNILAEAGFGSEQLAGSSLSFSISPYDYSLNVSGVDDNTKSVIEKLLNSNNNSRELFSHLLKSVQFGGRKISDDVMMKFRAIREIKNVANADIRDFKQVNGGFINSSGENILDVYKKALETSTAVPNAFKGAAFDNFANIISKLSSKDISKIPDLTLSADYIGGSLQNVNGANGYGAGFSARV